MVFKNLMLLTIALLPLTTAAEFYDPTRPAYPLPATPANAAPAQISETDLVLSGIWISAKSRRATINGVLAKTGQTILGDVKIIKITKNAVTVQQNDTLKTLLLLQRPYKTR
ncbi:MAG: hypothetical protein ABL925_07300 [Methylococcales bacterium]